MDAVSGMSSRNLIGSGYIDVTRTSYVADYPGDYLVLPSYAE